MREPFRHSVQLLLQPESASAPERSPRGAAVPRQPAAVRPVGWSGPLQLDPEEWPTPEEADTMLRLEEMLQAPREAARPEASVILYQEPGQGRTALLLDPEEWPTPGEAELRLQMESVATQTASPYLARLLGRCLEPHSPVDTTLDNLCRRLEDSGIQSSENSYLVSPEVSPEGRPRGVELDMDVETEHERGSGTQ